MARLRIDPRAVLGALRAVGGRGPRITGNVVRPTAVPPMRTAGGTPITSSASRGAAQSAAQGFRLPSAGSVLGGLGAVAGLGAGAAALYDAFATPTAAPDVVTGGAGQGSGTGTGQEGSGQNGDWENKYPPDQSGTTAEQKLLELILKQAGVLADPEHYAQRRAIDLDVYRAQAQLARDFGMEQTRELTRRKIEGDTIAAWRGITEAQLKRDTAMGLGMMQMAYTAGMPNPNVLQAGASFAQQGAAGFTAPKSVI